MTTRIETMQAATQGPGPEASRRPKRLRRMRRIAVALVVLLLIGMTAQIVADWIDASRNEAPGEFVQMSDGRRIHMQLTGVDNDGPLVILEAGAGSFSTQWSWVQQQVSQFAPVLSYDRAGLGWSDQPVEARGPDAVTADLAELLAHVGIDGPYVLVGHSYGAVFSRMFASANPDEVAGLVLVDPAHEEQFERFPAMGDTTAAQVMRALARVGLFRALRPFDSIGADLDPEAFAQWRSIAYSTRYADAQAEEATYLVNIVSPWYSAQARHLGDTPLTVIQAADAVWPDAGMVGLQRELEGFSDRGQFQTIEGADHFSIVTNEQNAMEITQAIVEIVTGSSTTR